MKSTELNFECTHNHIGGCMTCCWPEGRVVLVHHFSIDKTCVLIDGEIKSNYHNLTIEEFMRLQCECQQIANTLN